MSRLVLNKLLNQKVSLWLIRIGGSIILAGAILSLTGIANGRHFKALGIEWNPSNEKTNSVAQGGRAKKHPDAAVPFNYADGHAELTTKIFIVRHADRLGDADELSALGIKRASELKRVLAPSKIDSIFSTNFVRTKKTAQPLSSRRTPIQLYSDEMGLVKRIIQNCSGKRVLVVGHSNTVDDIIKKCGCVPPPSIDPEMPITQFDNLFLVLLYKIPGQLELKCELVHMKYGAVTN